MRKFKFAAFIPVVMLLSNIGAAGTFIRANQIGYESRGDKNAIVFSDAPLSGDFQVLDCSTRKIVFKGRLNPLTGVKWGTNEHHAELDFSRLRREGHYVVAVD